MGGTMDKLGAGLGKIFDPGSMAVKGTGETVGELKDLGYGAGDIDALGGGSPSVAQRIARGAMGAAAGGAKGMSQPPRSGGGPSPIQVAPTPDVSGFYPQQPIMPRNPYDPYGSAFLGR